MAVTTTLVDIARETNTSVSTVSRVLAGGAPADRISADTRQRVHHAAKKLGYRPNLLARGLRTRKTFTVAFLVSDIANPFFGRIASLVEQALRRHAYSLMVCNSCEDPELEQEYLDLLPSKGIDGLILVPLLRGKKSLIEILPKNMPLVILDRPIAGIPACVSSDEEQAAGSLCDTLERVGVKKVVLIHGPHNIWTHRRRSEIISARFEVLARIEGPAQIETGRQAFIHSLTQQPDAVICTNNFLAAGFIDSIESIQRPPIIGMWDELPLMHLLPLPIISAVQDIPMLADGCVKQLLPQLDANGGAEIHPILLPTRLVTNLAFQTRFEQK